MNRIADAAPAYRPAPAANSDAVCYDLFAALCMLERLHTLPMVHVAAVVANIEALPGPFERLPIGTLLQLVHNACADAVADKAAAGNAAQGVQA